MSSAKTGRPVEAVLGIVTGFVILYWLFRHDWMLYVAMILGLLGLFSPWAARWIDYGWGQLTRAIGFVNSRILLGTIFFIILTPISWLWRIGRKETMQRRPDTDSYFQERNHAFSAKDFEKPF